MGHHGKPRTDVALGWLTIRADLRKLNPHLEVGAGLAGAPQTVGRGPDRAELDQSQHLLHDADDPVEVAEEMSLSANKAFGGMFSIVFQVQQT